jgi:hypothetical protein
MWEAFGMTEEEYREWWPLHVRVAGGESLAPEEQARYETGVRALDAREAGTLTRACLAQLEEVRAQITELREKEQALVKQRGELEAESGELERRFAAATTIYAA